MKDKQRTVSNDPAASFAVPMSLMEIEARLQALSGSLLGIKEETAASQAGAGASLIALDLNMLLAIPVSRLMQQPARSHSRRYLPVADQAGGLRPCAWPRGWRIKSTG